MRKKLTWKTLYFDELDKGSLLKLDEIQDVSASAYAIKKTVGKFWRKQGMRTSKFIAALYCLYKMKHPRFMQKATRKNLTRRKYGT